MNSVIKKFETGDIARGFENFVHRFPEYADYAQELSNEAESYRNFDVGAVLVAIRAGSSDPLVMPGTNFKVNHAHAELNTHEELLISDIEDLEVETMGEELYSSYGVPASPNKNCAEMTAMLKLEDYVEEELQHKGEYPEIYVVGLVVAGSTDEAEIRDVTGGIKAKTLPPCLECTKMLHAKNATSRATLYASTGFSWQDPFEIRTIRHLRALYQRRKEFVHPQPSLLSPNIGDVALKIYRSRMAYTELPEHLQSRVISSIARHALLEAGRSS